MTKKKSIHVGISLHIKNSTNRIQFLFALYISNIVHFSRWKIFPYNIQFFLSIYMFCLHQSVNLYPAFGGETPDGRQKTETESMTTLLVCRGGKYYLGQKARAGIGHQAFGGAIYRLLCSDLQYSYVVCLWNKEKQEMCSEAFWNNLLLDEVRSW